MDKVTQIGPIVIISDSDGTTTIMLPHDDVTLTPNQAADLLQYLLQWVPR